MAPCPALVGALALLLAGCPRGGEERTRDDADIGVAVLDGLSLVVEDSLGHVRAADVDGRRVSLWAQAPVLALTALAEAAGSWELTFGNCMTDSQLTAANPAIVIDALPRPRATVCPFRVTLPAGEQILRLAPPDADDGTRWRFAVMGDIQTGLDQVVDVFEQMNRDPTIRFVVSTGDIVETGEESEYETFEDALEHLDVPYFSTIGNHELWSDIERWQRRFGRVNAHFTFRGVVFSLLDSASASIDPIVYGWLDDWLATGADRVHLVFTHYPPIDPVGIRQGSFRSRKEARKLLALLAAGDVDATFYGHIHSYYAFENAGMPAYISGGGGALPERWDGVGRHFLAVDVDARRIISVGLVRVDR